MKKLLGMVVASAVVVGAWQWHHSGSATTDDSADAARNSKLIFDRVWIDHLPRGETDTIQIFLAIRGEGVGAFQATSMWAGNYEAFRFEAKGGEMRAVFPQTRERETIKLDATECHDVDNMDYCLDVVGASRGVKHYYSGEGWEIGANTTLAAAVAQAKQLAAAQLAR
jgi:hypothetical protein|nr:hypothetical protein [Kofleriaceae bacterium]